MFEDRTLVERDTAPLIDSSRLVLFDYAPPAKFTHTAIKEAARDATQLLLNRIFELPTKVEDHSIFAQLEEPTYRVPRCKSVSFSNLVKPLTV